jgi:hypothetical protein
VGPHATGRGTVAGGGASAAEVAPEVEEIIAAYRKRFDQLSVLHAEHPVCVVFS